MEQTFSSSTLKLRHIFGVNTTPNNVHMLDKQKVFFISGNNVVKNKLQENNMSFIPGSENYYKITSISLSQNKNYLAIAETGSKPIIYLYDPVSLRKKKFLAFSDKESNYKEHSYMKFMNKENEYLFSVTKSQTNNLCLWDLNTSSLLSHIDLETANDIHCIDFSYNDNGNFTVVGDGFARIFNIEGGILSTINHSILPESELQGKSFKCGKYLKKLEMIVFSYESNNLLITDLKGKVLKHISMDFKVCTFFAVNNGIRVFSASMDSYNYAINSDTFELLNLETSKCNIPNFCHLITSLDYVEDNKTGCFISAQKQLYHFEIKQNKLFIRNVSEDNHTANINSVDVAIKKTLFVTCSSDKTAKIWNYQNYKLETTLVFNEEPLNVVFHPSGFHIVIAFNEKVSLYNVYPDYVEFKKRGLRDINLKDISQLCFSKGGEKLAIAAGNPQIIYVYKFYNCERINYLILKGHSGKITYLEFSKDDMYLYSCGTDGMVYQWNILNGTRNEIITKGSPLNNITMHQEKFIFFMAANDEKSLIEYNDKFKRKHDCGVKISQVKLSNNSDALFVSSEGNETSSGFIRYYGNNTNLESYENYQAHTTMGVSKFILTHNEQKLITVGKDGLICLFDVKNREEVNISGATNYSKFSNEVLVTKNEIEEIESRKVMLQNNIQDNYFQNNNIMALNNLDDKIKTLKEKATHKEKEEVLLINEAEKRKQEALMQLEEEYYQLKQTYDEEIHELEHQYNKELNVEATRIEESKQKHQAFDTANTEKLSNLKMDFEEVVKTLIERFKSKVQEKENQKNAAKEEKHKFIEKNQKKLKIIESEIDHERKNLTTKYTEDMANKKEEAMKIKNQAITLKKKKDNYNVQVNAMAEIFNEKLRSLEPLRSNLSMIKSKINDQKKSIFEMNKVIVEKEKKIYELKKATQELEKYKYVLDYTIKDLNKEIGPKELEIKELKMEISGEDNRLKNYNSVNINLESITKSLEKESEAMNQKIKTSNNTLIKLNLQLNNLKKFVFDLVQMTLDFDGIQQKIGNFSIDRAEELNLDDQIDAEYLDQIEYLEESVNKFKANIKKDTELHKRDNRNYIRDNIKLIKEILRLRKELKGLRTSEKPETILIRKDKRVRNIVDIKENELDSEEKLELIDMQEEEIEVLRAELESVSTK